MGSSPLAAGLLLLHWGPSRAPVQTERAERREGSFRERQTAKESMRVEEIFDRVVARFIGTKHERDIKRIMPLVAAINALEPEMQRLSDAEMLAKTKELKAQVAERLGDAQSDDPQYKEQLEAALEPALVPAFALAREAGRRKLSMRHFDVQLIGGTVLHQGKIAEMKTGEGKTLVAPLPAYLNSLTGRGVHIVTVNDYLARRDAEWMGPIYRALDLTVGVIVHDLDDAERRAAYGADITYGTNNEFGFDYLRDNMKFRLADCVQRGHHFSIVDEVDSILIDEARTPLIISGPSEESTDKYYKINLIIPKLVRGEVIEGKEPGEKYTTGDYTIDEKHRAAALTEEGVLKVEKLLGLGNLYEPANIEFNHHVQQALRAHVLYQRDREYVVKDGDEGPEVIIVDEFTGRLMPGRRWSDGLHQAVEAKEGVRIREENQTLATITIQNYFRMYKKLAGMTGTADTEAVEFKKIYNLDVVVIPPNKPMIRLDHPDVVYKTEREKFNAVIDDITECHSRGQPVLVGTISVEKSEHLSKLLKRKGVKHSVLNAVNHEAEANIIAQAGRFSAVTIATNMAGRGTDILLGGNPEFLARAEIEKRWLNKGGTTASAQAGKSYEESLEELRAEYNEAVSRARQQYEQEWLPFEEARNAALKRLTETYRPFLHASWQKARAEYADLAARLDSAEGGAGDSSLFEQYTRACAAYEHALSEYDKVIGPSLSEDQQQEYEAVRAEYATMLDGGGATVPAGRVQTVRGRYERLLGDYSRAIGRVAGITPSENGEAERLYEEASQAYEDAVRAYEEAERRYEEKHKPYEAAVDAAERVYEEKRRQP